MMFSQAMGQKVVDTSTATTAGKVSGILVDPKTRMIVALELKKTDTGRVLRWSDLTGFGTDAVTIPGLAVITDVDVELKALSGKTHALLNKRVLTTGGDDVGTVRDVDFDPQSGGLTTIVLDGTGGANTIAGDRLLGIGSYAVIVGKEHGLADPA